ncbi:hypothetical protein AMECASPLE_008937 [Ameca splendens]|uniref:Uncharacterized protein n=1 Tax=Ameca splendens TaxID=208324 RepID=A0ABV0YMJ7_9TELE
MFGGWLPPGQVEQFKDFSVLYTADGWMEQENDRWIGTSSAVMWSLVLSVMVKKELGEGKGVVGRTRCAQLCIRSEDFNSREK